MRMYGNARFGGPQTSSRKQEAKERKPEPDSGKALFVASKSIKKLAVFTSAKTSPAGGRQRSGRLPEICGRLPEIRGRLPAAPGSCRQVPW